jgi:uracil-DNA glycosylase family 4
LGDCKRCPLWENRNHLVFGEGDPHAQLMFVGEAPGREEDLQGRPFVGQAGRILTQFLQGIGLSRDEVYIANILKCRPPGNRTPQSQETEACLPFLLKQIQAIQPRIICTLGAIATQTLLGQKASITRIRGQSLPWRWGIKLFPTFHPAYLLRNPGQKKRAYQDFLQLKELLEAQA